MFWLFHGVHAGLRRCHAAFKVVAAGTGGDDIIPIRFAAEPSGDHMVDCQVANLPTAVLTCEIVPPKDFFSCQLDNWPGAFNHTCQTDNGWQGECLRHGSNHPSSIHDQRCPFGQDHIYRMVGRCDVDWLKVCIQHKNRFVHNFTIMIISVLNLHVNLNFPNNF